MHVDAYSYSLTAALSTLCPVMVHVQCVPFPLRLRCDIRRACQHPSFHAMFSITSLRLLGPFPHWKILSRRIQLASEL